MNYVGNKWLNLPWKGRLATEHYQLMNEMAQNIYNSIREILLCDEDIDFCCKLL